MTRPRDGNGSYWLDLSLDVGKELTGLQRQASRRGQGKEFASAFRRIVGILRRNPNKAGEPLFRLASLGLQVRTIIVAPLVIDFAVNEEHHIVYIRGGKLLSARQ